MKPRIPLSIASALFLFFPLTATHSRAGSKSPDQNPSVSNPSENTRYGLFGLLDHRSSYGEGVLPEPFLVDDSDLEVGEGRLDWLRSGVANSHTDLNKNAT